MQASTNPNIRINVYTFGCAKNLYDSGKLMNAIQAAGREVVHESPLRKNDIVIINTCGFINDAKQESVDAILEFVDAKQKGEIQSVYVFGCLSERYKEALNLEIPDADHIYGINSFDHILSDLGLKPIPIKPEYKASVTPPHYAFIKIADGCDQKCSFCAIPLIKGKHQSGKMEVILEEANSLIQNGVKEIILVAQDTTFYGMDIYKKREIVELIKNLSSISGLEWLRIQYTYPNAFPVELLELINEKENICKYIDIPLQHISDAVLKRMRRGITSNKTRKLIQTIREKIPNVAIRTTLLVGFPGETQKDFEELSDFVRESSFDRLGVFTYSHEEGTEAFGFKNNIPEKVKKERAAQIMSLQQDISYSKNQMKVGSLIKTLIDKQEGDFFIGRSEHDSPDVDNEIIVTGKAKVRVGNFYDVRITEASDFDLYGYVEFDNNG